MNKMRHNRPCDDASRAFLVVDVGNTTIHVGVCEREALMIDFRLPSAASVLRRKGRRTFRRYSASYMPLSGAMVSSVVPLLNPVIHSLLRGICPRVEWLSHRTPTGIKLRYKRPREIGSDRIANVAAARELYGTPAIVVDIGTAITFDCISTDGAYLGGIIAPGPRLSRAALAEHTGLLPFVEIDAPPGIIGKSTVHAIQAGMILGTRALISGLLRELRKKMGGRPRVIFTGGQTELIIKGWNYPKIIDPRLTLQGLRIIYNKLVNRR